LPAAGASVWAGWANDAVADDENARAAMGCWAARVRARRAEVERIIVGWRVVLERVQTRRATTSKDEGDEEESGEVVREE